MRVDKSTGLHHQVELGRRQMLEHDRTGQRAPIPVEAARTHCRPVLLRGSIDDPPRARQAAAESDSENLSGVGYSG